MQEEIKEILDNFKNNYDELGSCYYPEDILGPKDLKLLLDYITNLQEKVDQYENPEDYTLFYMWLDEKAKDKMKELQEENKKLKDLCNKYEEEHKTAFKLWKQEIEKIPTYEEKIELVDRINKAVEYIEDDSLFDGTGMVANDLLNILQGVDKE